MNIKFSGVAQTLVGIAFFGVCPHVWGSGFGLYEASSKGYAMGGAVLGRAVDASANFYNPATLTDLTNATITVGFMTEHPRARIKVDGRSSEVMDSGVFALPHFHLALPLPADFVLGLGLMPEYGLGSKYSDGWTLEGSSTETTVTSFSVNPNVAWRITDRWSIGVGLRFVYFDFEQYSTPLPGGLLNHRLKGDNNMNDFGYQIGTKYDLTDNFSVGVVYKSLTVINVHGKSEQNGSYLQSTTGLGASRAEAQTDLELPQSITGGFNWDITPEVHLGGTVGWTQWSSVDTLLFNLGGRNTLCKLDWNDTWRVGLAPSWDFAEDWTAIMSYVFENDCCGDQESTMLPAANRHMLSWGLAWECLEELELALTYGMILMDGQETQSYGYKADPVLHHYKAFRGISHAAGLTLTYRF